MPSNISHPISIPNPTTTTSTTTLKTNKDWPKWNNETLKILKIRNLTHLLKDTNKPPPTSPSHRKWTNSQKTTCALIISKLSPAIAKAMRSHKTLETLLQALDTYTKPTPTEALEMLISLWGRLSSLSSSDHASVTDYVAEARDIKAQYIRLGTGVSDAVLSCAFMAGLPVQWREWKMRRMRDQTVLVPWGDCSSSTFLFENLLRDAVEEEARLYEVARREEEVRWGVEVRDVCGNQATVVVDFCSLCRGVFHRADECSRLRLRGRRSRSRNLKANLGLKRRRADSRGRYTAGNTSSNLNSLSASMRLRLGTRSDAFLFSS